VDWAVRIYGEKTELFIDRNAEAEAIQKMHEIGVSPALVKYVPEINITVVDYISDSYTMKNDDFLNVEFHEMIMEPILKIHRSGIQLSKMFDPLVEIQKMTTILNDLSVSYPEFDIKGMIKKLDYIFNKINIPKNQYTACHIDLLPENFIMVINQDSHFPNPIYLIDWEYAGMAPKYYDLADMFQEILAPRETEHALIDIYCSGKNNTETTYLIDMMKPFPDFYWFLWSLIQQNISKIKFDYYNYGKEKFRNSLKNISILSESYGIKI
jgi:thiamine kinase-like enzyme